MPELPGFFWTSFWIFIISLAAISVFIWLFVKGNKRYDVDDAESHSEEFAELVKEGHGQMTLFLWVSFSIIFAWTVYYFVVNWSQFYVISALRL